MCRGNTVLHFWCLVQLIWVANNCELGSLNGTGNLYWSLRVFFTGLVHANRLRSSLGVSSSPSWYDRSREREVTRHNICNLRLWLCMNLRFCYYQDQINDTSVDYDWWLRKSYGVVGLSVTVCIISRCSPWKSWCRGQINFWFMFGPYFSKIHFQLNYSMT